MADPARAKPRTFEERRIAQRYACRAEPCIQVAAMLVELYKADPPCVVCVHEAEIRRKMRSKS